jgi:hypothetical protein
MSVTPSPTVGITIGTAAFPTLTAQPFGYEETNTRAGQTARKWLVTGLLKPSEWVTLLGVYDAWRNTRIDEVPTETSKVVGTTIALSAKGPGTLAWTNVACWFISAPEAEQSGAYLSASVELVDANQALAVLLKQEEAEAEEEEGDLPDLGTFTLGSAVLTLLKPPDTYSDLPQLELTATGNHLISGPKVIVRVKDIEGTTNASGWTAVRSWYETNAIATPAAGAYFPISVPTATAENKIVGGAVVIQYTVSIQLGVIV